MVNIRRRTVIQSLTAWIFFFLLNRGNIYYARNDTVITRINFLLLFIYGARIFDSMNYYLGNKSERLFTLAARIFLKRENSYHAANDTEITGINFFTFTYVSWTVWIINAISDISLCLTRTFFPKRENIYRAVNYVPVTEIHFWHLSIRIYFNDNELLPQEQIGLSVCASRGNFFLSWIFINRGNVTEIAKRST